MQTYCWGWCQPDFSYTMCQPMPTGLYTRWDFDSKTRVFTLRQNKSRSFENMVMSYFHRTRPECETGSFFTTSRQQKVDCFTNDGLCSHCNIMFEAMVCFYHFFPVNSCVLLSLKRIFNVVAKRESVMHWDDLICKGEASS